MAKRNVLIKKRNNGIWDELYPITNAENVKTTSGDNVEIAMDKKANKDGTLQTNLNSELVNGQHFFVSLTQPTANVKANDIWFDTTDFQIKAFDGTNWIPFGSVYK